MKADPGSATPEPTPSDIDRRDSALPTTAPLNPNQNIIDLANQVEARYIELAATMARQRIAGSSSPSASASELDGQETRWIKTMAESLAKFNSAMGAVNDHLAETNRPATVHNEDENAPPARQVEFFTERSYFESPGVKEAILPTLVEVSLRNYESLPP